MYFSSDIPREPSGALKLPSARVGSWPGLPPLGVPDGGLSPCAY